MKPAGRLAAVAALVFSLTAVAAANGNLAVGSPAPAMRVGGWVKGTPIHAFEKGKVYVVEFWATWCVPCQASMLHLTELAKKYSGKVTFAGISIWENHRPLGNFASVGDKVAASVKEYGDRMAYNVAFDGDDAMAQSWMAAAGQKWIPTAFIVDRTGAIVWIGQPMLGLDEALGQVLDGTFDVPAEAEKEAKVRTEQERRTVANASYSKPFSAGDFKGAVAGMDKLIASDSTYEVELGVSRYIALSNFDSQAANNYARKLENGIYKSRASELNSLAWAMVDDKGQAKGADFKLAVEIGERCVAVTKDHDPQAAYNLDTLAYCLFKDGQIDRAIAAQGKALEAADATKGFDADTRRDIAGRLEMFKRKKGAG